MILLAGYNQRVAVQVDEIVGEVELSMKPLVNHLQRPGIVGNAIDADGNVSLIVDLSILIQHAIPQCTHVQMEASSAGLSVPVQPATILVADDSVYMRQSLRLTLERAGYRVVEARDGIEALEYLTSDQKPDVLVLDIEMPNLNGYDLLNILHEQPELAEYKTIMLTSRSSEMHRQRALELGAYAFLSKPCPADVLLETVHQALVH